MTKDEIILAQQARIEQLNTALNKFLDSHEECTDFDGFTAYIVSMDDFHDAQEEVDTEPDDLLALRAHDEKLLAPYQWQPIETAPKDGTEVLLYLGEPYSHIEKARWFAPWGNWQTGDLPDDPDGEEYHGIGSKCPTHWMPIHSAEAIEKGGV